MLRKILDNQMIQITKVTREEYNRSIKPLIVEVLSSIEIGEVRKIEGYNYKSPLPAYLNSMIKDKRYSTHKMNATTYYVIRVK